MLIIDPRHEILSHTINPEHTIERAARVCYKSEDSITDDSHKAMIKMLKKRGHEAMLEHAVASVLFVTNRGVSHEFVRHRIASFAQESTRYVNYGGKGCVFIRPVWCSGRPLGEWPYPEERTEPDLPEGEGEWFRAMLDAERAYHNLLTFGWEPQQAREVLPNSTKTEIIVTANFREWRHIFKLRALGTTGKPHPEMVRIMVPCLREFAVKWSTVFGDLVEMLDNKE